MQDDIALYVQTAGPLDDYVTWLLVHSILCILLFGVHLTAGILSLRYSFRAPRWITLYGVAALVLIVTDIVVSVITFPGGPSGGARVCEIGFDQLVGPRIALAAVALPWPIIALALMNTRAAKQSCRS
jgi:hypothetical protein